MNTASLLGTTPSARNPRKVILKDYALEFHLMSPKWGGGVATIVQQPDSYIEGVLWETDELTSLDIREETPHIYYKTSVEVQLGNELITATTYILHEKYHEVSQLPPSLAYMQAISEGAEEHLSREYNIQLEKQFKQYNRP